MRNLVVLAALGLLAGCATGYHSTGFTGGFEEIQIGPKIFQVRFNGNAYTSQGRAANFLLRRCAELTLENGYRYFEQAAADRLAQTASAGTMGNVVFPSGQATIRFLDNADDSKVVLDAIFVMDSTSKAADGKMSPRAAEAYQRLKDSH